MTLTQIVLLAVAGFVAGMVNAVAGGGTFFSFAALVATGLSSLDANATSSVALTPGYLASLFAYRDEIRVHYRQTIAFALIGIVGGAVGAWLLLSISDAGFRPLVPWLLLLATLLFAFSNQIKMAIAPLATSRAGTLRIVALALIAIVSVYGGFFGAGMGIMVLAALAVIEEGDFHKANTIKIVMTFLIQLVSASMLAIGGLVHWQPALVVMVTSVIGGYLGVGVARKVPERMVRYAVVSVGVLLTLMFFLR